MTAHIAPEPPQFPAGPFAAPGSHMAADRETWLRALEELPGRVRAAVDGLDETQLDTTYRNWTIRQIVHHLADSHLNMYVRVKLTLTEARPTVKPYDESRWSALADARTAAVAPSLAILDGVHARWIRLMRAEPAEAFDREFYHPESRETVPLWRALAAYAWHGRHHTAQIEWVKAQKL